MEEREIVQNKKKFSVRIITVIKMKFSRGQLEDLIRLFDLLLLLLLYDWDGILK
jgi:hypothetical protein